MNPISNEYKTVFSTVPFEEIKNEHYLPALEEGIKIAKDNLAKIKANPEPATFENTIVALERSGDAVDKVAEIFFNLLSAETNDEMQEIAKEFSPKITAYGNDILLDAELFSKVKEVWENKDSFSLDAEDLKLLEKNYKSFVRNGALLNETQKSELRSIDEELSTLSLNFGNNNLKETNKYEMVLENESDLAGLPDGAKEAAAMIAKEKGYEGKWVITLDYPSLIPFMTYAENRDLREKLYRANTTKSCKGDELDNKENVKRFSVLRHKRANLLGYASHADFTLEERMASTPGNVGEFLENLLSKSKPHAQNEIEELKKYVIANGGPEDLQNWDTAFWSEKLKKEKFSVDDEMLKPYFKLENVIDGVFQVASKLYGLNFNERSDIQKYHKDVMTYEVTDESGKHIAAFYADFFPRATKRNGAWMTAYRGQSNFAGEEKRPHISIVCNFTKPTETKPSLLTFNEVTTLFHEFGHALHGMLADTKYPSLSGTSVFWDFVELPSQILENWAYEQECLALFAKHYETGEVIPSELVQKIKDSASFHAGMGTMRQLSFALLDMAWHSGDNSSVDDAEAFEKKAMESTTLLPKVDGSMMSTSFGHIFAGGYSSGYYSYKWAEVLDADAFEHFKENGIFNREIAKKFKDNILSKGGTEHPMELYKKFRGAEPTPDALLRRSGLI
ncbi:M3 family metallopeptidase [Halobacteriovorax sp. HLS]|uniref:M3 family metallopeptidase n=1 Tax=Halobacteriovorax sp. HLS TaxID=2234000 RepID=UPI000FDB15D3|nr:M3 family metallopeptidase [Halobacteriovorax sp. HLS]